VAWDDVEVKSVQLIFDNTLEVNATITGHWENHWNWTYEWNTTEFDEGWHLVCARAYDGELLSEKHCIEVFVDNEAENQRPEVEIDHPVGGATVKDIIDVYGWAWDDVEVIGVDVIFDNTIEVEANISWSHEQIWNWTYEWNTSEFEDGWHLVCARAWDGELLSEKHCIEVFVDNEAENQRPKVEIDHPVDGAEVSGVIDIYGWAWDDVEVIAVDVIFDNSIEVEANVSWHHEQIWKWTYEWDTTKFDDGWHLVCARAWDGELLSEKHCIEVYVNNVEGNHRPWVTIEYPENWEVVSGVIDIGGHAGDPDENDTVELVQIAIHNDDIWLDCNDTSGNGTWWTWVYELDTTKMENGKYFILARAFDGELYSLYYESHIIVENEVENRRPEVTIVHPENHQEVWGIVLVHGEAWDPDLDDKVEKVVARINSGEWFMTVDTSHDHSWSTWAFQWNTMEFENGWHGICAKSYDGELWSEVVCVEVLVENENHRPEVTIVHPETGEVLEGLVLIHGMAWDPDEGDSVEMVLVRINDGDWKHATDTSPDGSFETWAYEWNTKKWDDGEHRICAKSYDGQLFSEVVCVDVVTENVNDPPRVEILHPEMDSEVSGIVLVHGSAKDDHGVEGVYVKIGTDDWDKAVDVSKDHSWRTWAYEWVTTEYENGEYRVCAKAYDGELWSDLDCVEVYVNNTHEGQVEPGQEGILGNLDITIPLVLLGIASLVAGIIGLIRRHLNLRKQ
jgi:hypothetical protein